MTMKDGLAVGMWMSKKQEAEVVNVRDQNVERSFVSQADILTMYSQVLLLLQNRKLLERCASDRDRRRESKNPPQGWSFV